MESAVSPVARPPVAVRGFHEPLPPGEQASLVSRAAALPLACAVCAASAGVAVVVADPGSDTGGLLPCPFRALTGRWCPGCGLTRATHHLFRGNVAQALSFHLFVPLVVAALVGMWVVWLRVATGRGVPRRVMAITSKTYIAMGAVVVLFTIVRNFPGLAVLRGG